ncbi:MAG: D-ribose pyranase [Chloroflexi bacterium]|nr:D-ribose pyranase [Chloroflexota bacterium]
MKKEALINIQLSELVASLGHTDEFVIADAGLPIPGETWRIDLALTRGIPSFEDTLQIVLEEAFIEKAIVAQEMQEISPQIFTSVKEILGDLPIEMIPHPDFKTRTRSSRAIIRTGEFTPYANIILVSGAWGFDV